MIMQIHQNVARSGILANSWTYKSIQSKRLQVLTGMKKESAFVNNNVVSLAVLNLERLQSFYVKHCYGWFNVKDRVHYDQLIMSWLYTLSSYGIHQACSPMREWGGLPSVSTDRRVWWALKVSCPMGGYQSHHVCVQGE